MIPMVITEEQFLDLYKYTRKKVKPQEFLNVLNSVVYDEKKISYNDGARMVLKHWKNANDDIPSDLF